MTAAEAREELESAIWRTGPASLQAMQAVLDAADRYAAAFASDMLDELERDRRTNARRALIAGDSENYGSTL
jgi:hypothetical protein